MAIAFKKINRLNNEDCDDIYLINKTRRRKYDFFDFSNDEERDKAFDEESHEPAKREYEDRYQMQRVSDIPVGRLNRELKKPHLLMRFTDEE